MRDDQTFYAPANGQVTDGMTVYANDGDKLGSVNGYDPRDGFIDVRKGWLFTKDIYVPVAAITHIAEHEIVLGVSKADLEDDRYTMPPANAEFHAGGQGIVHDTGAEGAEQPEPVILSDGSVVGTGAVRKLPHVDDEIERVTAGRFRPDAPDLADELREDPRYRIR